MTSKAGGALGSPSEQFSHSAKARAPPSAEETERSYFVFAQPGQPGQIQGDEQLDLKIQGYECHYACLCHAYNQSIMQKIKSTRKPTSKHQNHDQPKKTPPGTKDTNGQTNGEFSLFNPTCSNTCHVPFWSRLSSHCEGRVFTA